MVGKHGFLAATILSVYLIAGILYATLTPKWQAPDEPAHYNYVHYLATRAGFPELTAHCYNQSYLNELTSRRFPPDMPVHNVCYEYHQPPLYYVLATPFFTLSDGSLMALRLFSVALGGGVVFLAFLIGHAIFPNRPAIALGTMAFTAFVPMHVAILASVNNDALAELILALLLLLMIRRLLGAKNLPSENSGPTRADSRPPLQNSGPPSLKSNLLLGALLGLGLVTKTTVYIAIPLVAITLWFESDRQPERQSRWPGLVKQAALIYGLALLIALPWYLRNLTLYGNFDVLGLGRHDEVVVGQLRTADFLAQVGAATYLYNFISTTFRSFWGQFGWMAVPMDSRTYLLLTLLTLMAIGGLLALLTTARPATTLSPGQRDALRLMVLAILLMGLAYGGYNLTFVQFQGRYLFPSLIPLGLFFSLGLTEALQRRWAWWLIGGLALALGWVVISAAIIGNLDKWALLIIGLALGVMAARLWIARYWAGLTPWLLTICYAGLGLLTLVGPFWFVVPYL